MALAAMLAGVARAQTGDELRLAGASAIGARLAPDLLAAFAAARSGRPLRPSVAQDGTGAGLAALAAGRADVAMAARPVTDEERITQLRAGFGDPAAPANASVVALEALAVIVNRDNAIGILTLDQVQRLFSGQIGNWSSLGGRDLPVTIYRRDDASEAVDVFPAIALGRDQVAPSAVPANSAKGVADAVAADPGGIGLVDFADLGAAKPVTLALACGLTIEPKPFNVRSEEYPLTRRLYFYTAADTSPLVQDFVAFSLSAAAQPIVRRAGLIDLTPEPGAPGDALPQPGMWEPAEARHRRAILAGIIQSLAGARRLSTTFRFEADGATPDARAHADIGRIASYKRANPGHRLILVGYWSRPGSFDANLAVSARRAQEIASALAAAGAPPDQVLAGSTLRPIACDEGSRRDDRVEVWLR